MREKFFFIMIVLSFVSMMLFLRKQWWNLRGRKEANMEELEQVWKRGYAWKSVALCGDRWNARTCRMGREPNRYSNYTPVWRIS